MLKTSGLTAHLATKPLSRRVAPPAFFAAATLALGMAVAAAGYALGDVPDAGVRRPPLYPADWMFWSIWLILYPTMGIASYHLWRNRHLPRTRIAWRFYLLGLASNLTWVPVVHLFHSPVAAPAVMDAVAGVLMLPALWAVTRSNKPAFLWLLPLMTWGPITGALKIWQLVINQPFLLPSTWRLVEWSLYAGALSISLQLFFLYRGMRVRGIS